MTKEEQASIQLDIMSKIVELKVGISNNINFRAYPESVIEDENILMRLEVIQKVWDI